MGTTKKEKNDILTPGSAVPKLGKMAGENQVVQDLEAAKKLTGNFFDRLKGVGGVSSKKTLAGFSKKPLKSGLLKSKMFGGGLVAILILLLSLLVFKTSNRAPSKDPGGGKPLPNPQPTLPPIRAELPSIYAEDEEVLSIEREVKVLDGELVNLKLNDPQLSLPVLDYNVSF